MDIQSSLQDFLENDQKSVDALNDSVAWHGYSTEKQVSFLSWRVSHTAEFLIVLANHLAAQQSVPRTGLRAGRKNRYSSSYVGGSHNRR